ncbi:MAG: hypothetical protein LZF62_480218 [Nitrospira sp.]|nr:MAG: hypothetical protein LZF62_480218 [Nitrospira sp.]
MAKNVPTTLIPTKSIRTLLIFCARFMGCLKRVQWLHVVLPHEDCNEGASSMVEQLPRKTSTMYGLCSSSDNGPA